MNRKFSHRFVLLLLLVWSTVVAEGKVTYATDRLRSMAELLPLAGIDKLSAGEHICFSYNNYPLIVRINEWKEVEHIGFYLFRDSKIRQYNPSPVYDFLERYFLELKMPLDIGEAIRLFVDKVYIEGNLNVIFSFDGTEVFTESYVKSKSYIINWNRNGKDLLSVAFDMDYQLLSGCNAIELEQKLVRDIKRHKKLAVSGDKNWDELEWNQGDIYTEQGTTYLLDLIRNDLYFEKKGDKAALLYDSRKPNQTIANMMLSADTPGDFDLYVDFDLYGYREEKVCIKLKQWLNYCISNGCVPYFGIKSKDETSLKGTVFMVNEKGGYNHILSVDVPFSELEKQKGNIHARLYAFIPMHNVSDKYFQMK